MTDQDRGLSLSPEDAPDSPGKASVSAPGPSTPTIGTATGSSSGPILNARSCVTCRRRKVKCNKQYPCSNCLKAHIDCIFPAPGRAPGRPRKPPDGELLVRLRRLEGVIQSLGVQVDDDPRLAGSVSSDVHSRDGTLHDSTISQVERKVSFPNEQTFDQGRDSVNALGADLGRLVINEGRSRYVNNRFWTSLASEVENLKEVLDESSEDETADFPSPSSDPMTTPSQHGFLFSINSSANDVHSLHPPPDLIRKYWTLSVENCDPLMKMLHIPSMQQQVYAAAGNPGKSSKAIEVLLFAVYYATVTSLSAEECQELSGDSRETLLKRYRSGLEQALVRAHFMATEEIVVLQAFIIFLLCLRRYEDPRILWSLCGVACRVAITLGLHHDGTNLGISPYDIEIRRRTWWQILILDIRSAEDHGSDPVIIQHAFDTRFPLNVEDEDLSPSMTESPPERDGITKMSFCLTRYYTATTFARLFARPANFLSPTGTWPEPTFQEKQRWIQHCQQRLEDRFFRHYDLENPLHWITHTVSRLILAKQWLLIYQPFLRSKLGAELPVATREHLFITSLEAIESAIELEKQRLTVKWGWLFKTYTQFHAMAFLLSELTRRTRGPMVDRAWRAVENTKAVLWETHSDIKQGPMIKPLLKIEATARLARERALTQPNTTVGEDEDDPHVKIEGEQQSPGDADFIMANTAPGVTQGVYGFEHGTNASGAGFQTAGMHGGFVPQAVQSGNNFGNFYHGEASAAIPQNSQFPTIGQVPQQWSDGFPSHVGVNNSVPLADWFADPSYGPVPGADAGGGYHLGAQQQQQQQQQHLPHQQHQHSHQHQQHQQARGDPMVSGSEATGMQWPEWDEIWDEMMVTGQGSAANPQWQRRPVMAETWI